MTEPYATAGSSLTSAGWTPVRSATFSGVSSGVVRKADCMLCKILPGLTLSDVLHLGPPAVLLDILQQQLLGSQQQT